MKKELPFTEELGYVMLVTGKTQKEIAVDLGLKSASYLSELKTAEENGKRVPPRFLKLWRAVFKEVLDGMERKDITRDKTKLSDQQANQIIGLQATVEVLMEQVALLTMQGKVMVNEPTSMSDEVKALTKRVKVAVARRIREVKA